VAKKRVVTGQVIAVQEERLRLATDSGQNLLLTLRLNSHLPADLSDLLQTQALVRVVYEGEPNMDSGVVRSIDLV
jgi:hypothetical protein